jgi:hypothetical protein
VIAANTIGSIAKTGRISKSSDPFAAAIRAAGCFQQLRPVREHWFDDVATETQPVTFIGSLDG